MMPLIFQAGLGLEALLFGVFGFLYALYGAILFQFSSNPPPRTADERAAPAPRILKELVGLGRFTAVLISVCGGTIVIAAFRLSYGSGWEVGLTASLVLVAVGASLVSLYMAFRLMR